MAVIIFAARSALLNLIMGVEEELNDEDLQRRIMQRRKNIDVSKNATIPDD